MDFERDKDLITAVKEVSEHRGDKEALRLFWRAKEGHEARSIEGDGKAVAAQSDKIIWVDEKYRAGCAEKVEAKMVKKEAERSRR